MRKYELLLILPAEADDAVVGGVTDRLSGVIGRSGGEISKVDRWGRRRFAYEIERATEGFYLLAEFVADPGDVKELDRVLGLADDVIRFKVVVLPERRGRGRPGAHGGPRSEGERADIGRAESKAAAHTTEAPQEEPPVEEPAPAAGVETGSVDEDEEVAPAGTAPAGGAT